MPDISAPAPLIYSGGALRTFRVAPARLIYTAGNVTSVRETTTGTVTTPTLNRLYRLADKIDGETDKQFQRRQLIWQQSMEVIEEAFAALTSRVDEQAAILARLTAAETLAQAANDTAVAAVAQVEVVSTAVAETFTVIDPVFGTEYVDRVAP